MYSKFGNAAQNINGLEIIHMQQNVEGEDMDVDSLFGLSETHDFYLKNFDSCDKVSTLSVGCLFLLIMVNVLFLRHITLIEA